MTQLARLTRDCPRCGAKRRFYDDAAVGGVVRTERERAGVSMRQVAMEVGISPTHASDLENGRRGWRPSLLEQYRNAIKTLRRDPDA